MQQYKNKANFALVKFFYLLIKLLLNKQENVLLISEVSFFFFNAWNVLQKIKKQEEDI